MPRYTIIISLIFTINAWSFDIKTVEQKVMPKKTPKEFSKILKAEVQDIEQLIDKNLTKLSKEELLTLVEYKGDFEYVLAQLDKGTSCRVIEQQYTFGFIPQKEDAKITDLSKVNQEVYGLLKYCQPEQIKIP